MCITFFFFMNMCITYLNNKYKWYNYFHVSDVTVGKRRKKSQTFVLKLRLKILLLKRDPNAAPTTLVNKYLVLTRNN